MPVTSRFKTVEEKVPLALRRLGGPLLLVAAVTGIVLLLPVLGIPTVEVVTDPKTRTVVGERNCGARSPSVWPRLLLTRLWTTFSRSQLPLVERRRRPLSCASSSGFSSSASASAHSSRRLLSVSLTAVAATSAVLTAAYGFALQDTLGNLFSVWLSSREDRPGWGHDSLR